MIDARLRRLDGGQRQQFFVEYATICADRDGQPDFDTMSLPRRHAAGAAWRAAHLGTAGYAWPAGSPLEARASRWMGYLEEANVDEEWMVRRSLAAHRRRLAAGRHRPRDLADLQEVYHSRAFADVLVMLGGEQTHRRPALPARLSFAVFIRLPRRLARLPALVGELVGTVVFRELLEESEALLADDPTTAAAVADRLEEVLADEIGHVLLLLIALTAVERRILPLLLKAAARTRIIAGVPGPQQGRLAVDLLGWRLDLFSDRVLDRAIIPSAYQYARSG